MDGSRACSRCPHLHMSGAEARPRHAWGQLCHPHFADRGTLPTAQGLTSWTGQAGGQLVGPRHSVVTTVIRGPEGTPCWSEPRHCCLRLRQQLGSGLRYPAGSAPWGFVIVAESLPPACSLRQFRAGLPGGVSSCHSAAAPCGLNRSASPSDIPGHKPHNSQLDGSCFSFGVKTKCLCSDG